MIGPDSLRLPFLICISTAGSALSGSGALTCHAWRSMKEIGNWQETESSIIRRFLGDSTIDHLIMAIQSVHKQLSPSFKEPHKSSKQYRYAHRLIHAKTAVSNLRVPFCCCPPPPPRMLCFTFFLFLVSLAVIVAVFVVVFAAIVVMWLFYFDRVSYFQR